MFLSVLGLFLVVMVVVFVTAFVVMLVEEVSFDQATAAALMGWGIVFILIGLFGFGLYLIRAGGV